MDPDQKFTTMSEYIAQQPADVQPILQEIRAVIRQAAPEATEKISYQMPTFHLNGNLVHFAAYQHHIGFYPAVRHGAVRAGVVRLQARQGVGAVSAGPTHAVRLDSPDGRVPGRGECAQTCPAQMSPARCDPHTVASHSHANSATNLTDLGLSC